MLLGRKGKAIFKSKWVNSAYKTPLTACDLKHVGNKGEITSSPTTRSTIAVFELHMAVNGYPSVDFDIAPAFLHGLEENEEVYLDPPEEWFIDDETRRGMFWHLKRSLYARQTAGRDSREFFEAVLMAMPDSHFVQLDIVVILHVVDGRIGGPMSSLGSIVQWLCMYILLEVSDAIMPGNAVDLLKRT